MLKGPLQNQRSIKRYKEGKCTPEMENGKGGWKRKRDENNLTPLTSKLKCSEVFYKTLVVYDISEKTYDPVPKLQPFIIYMDYV